MKKYILFLLSFVILGCMTAKPQSQSFYQSKKNLTQVQKVYLGMNSKEVHALMGNEVVIGYERTKESQDFKPITVKNPYRTEELRSKDKRYYVEYYLTDIKKEDGIISNDELTPFVFEDNELMGKGWNYLFRLKNIINHN